MWCRARAFAWGLATLLSACGPLRDATTAHVDRAARAVGRDLSAERLARWMVAGRSLPLQLDVVERVAHLWVDYMLFADRVLAGDSLVDSTRVLAARWPDAQRLVVAQFHEQLVRERVRLDSAELDSVFAAGDWRFIRHILLRVTPDMSADQIASKRQQAEGMRARLAAGGPWSAANAVSDDSLARAQGGALGVVARGETVPPFEAAAFALAPGGLSPVTETPFGYHLVSRPRLYDVRQAFDAGVRQRLVARMDSAYLQEAESRRDLAVARTAPALVQRATASPLLFRLSDRAVARFDGGGVTVGDVLQWLDVLSPDVRQQIAAASDAALSGFVRTIAREAMLFVEASEAGTQVPPQEYERLRAAVAQDVAAVRTALALDAAGPEPGSDPVAARVDAYFDTIVRDLRRLVPVPRFLADRLRQETVARVYPAGVARAYSLATAMRASEDSAAGRAPGSGGLRP